MSKRTGTKVQKNRTDDEFIMLPTVDFCFKELMRNEKVRKGIIAALLEVIQDDKNNIINKKEICKIIELERSLFETQNQNWFVDNRCEKIGFGWCHGAPGILLSKIPELKFFNNKKILEEMNIALKTTLNYGFGANPSLCHGDLGNLQIIHWVARMNGDKELEKQCLENFDKYSRTIMLERWKGSSFRGSEAIGLMIGTAGFGYSILLSANGANDFIPIILVLIDTRVF